MRTELVKRQSIRLAGEQGEMIFSKEEDGNLYSNFVRQATRIPRLTEEEERKLGLLVKNFKDNSAAKKLVYHNMRLAIKMAHQHRRSWVNLMDLVQEALAGMGVASKRWDFTENTRFGTYAAYWIKAQLAKFLMTNARLIHTGNSRAGRKIYFALPQIRRKLHTEGLEPTSELIAKALGENPNEVELVLARINNKESSLSSPTSKDSKESLEDILSSNLIDPETVSSVSEIRNIIHKTINGFDKTLISERDKVIWKEHLIAIDSINLVDLGKRYGVSKQRMGQLADRVKKSFKKYIIDILGPQIQMSSLLE